MTTTHDSATKTKYMRAVPVIATADVQATVDYYASVLGFQTHFTFGEPPVYAGIVRDGMLLYVSLDPGLAAAVKASGAHPDVFLWVQNVDGMFAEHQQAGAKIVEELADRPWDARQYVIEDPNGYYLKIAEPLD